MNLFYLLLILCPSCAFTQNTATPQPPENDTGLLKMFWWRCQIKNDILVSKQPNSSKRLPAVYDCSPTTDSPTTDLPTTDLPTTDLPTTDSPTTDSPTTDSPTTDSPTTDSPTPPNDQETFVPPMPSQNTTETQPSNRTTTLAPLMPAEPPTHAPESPTKETTLAPPMPTEPPTHTPESPTKELDQSKEYSMNSAAQLSALIYVLVTPISVVLYYF